MTKDEMKNRISMALKGPILQQGFEIICKDLAISEHDREQLEKEKCELLGLIQGKDKAIADLKKENEELWTHSAHLTALIKKMSELINRYYMVCTEIPKELRTMTFDSCLEDTVKMVQDGVVKE